MKAVRITQIIVAVIYALVALVVFASPLLPTAQAETTQQMRERVAMEMIMQHPDLPSCDDACVAAWLDGNQWLVPFAQRAELPLATAIRAHQSWSYEWGVQFEQLYHRPPTVYDWTYAYADNCEAFRARFDVAPQMFAVNEWAERRFYRLKQEYGGPF